MNLILLNLQKNLMNTINNLNNELLCEGNELIEILLGIIQVNYI